jgi:hypothetical protein
MSSSKECPVYLKEREIQKKKIEKNISYLDARRQVSNDSSQNSKASYASAVKRTYTSSTTQTTLAWPPASDKPFKVPLPSTDVIITPTKYIKKIHFIGKSDIL